MTAFLRLLRDMWRDVRYETALVFRGTRSLPHRKRDHRQ